MSKKILTILIFLNILFLVAGEDVTLTKIEATSVKGNAYFPLFVGAKWTWSLEMFGSKNLFSWEIIEAYEITDLKNNLDRVIGFKTICKEIESEWFFIEKDGYISFYEKGDNGYDIQKIIPLNPKIGDRWNENFRINTISTITDEFIKIDTETEDKKTIGYKIFRKDIGLFDLYEIEKKDNDTIYTKWTLNEYKKYNENEKKDIVINENKQDTTTDNTIVTENKISEDKDIIENIDEYESKESKKIDYSSDYSKYFIKELNKNKSYIQIGSFSIIDNAIKILENATSYNYNIFIYFDKDGYYKVLIEIEKEEDKNIQFIRKNIEEKAFFKQRKR
ncbi:MAG TPA: hypothetical protein PLE45_08885 [Spirochaetota bacterium]|nr:hypothetical protein [Spirochaetota bacterium]HPP05211.1 hypothetical protein [Spirochaetota bacterium]